MPFLTHTLAYLARKLLIKKVLWDWLPGLVFAKTQVFSVQSHFLLKINHFFRSLGSKFLPKNKTFNSILFQNWNTKVNKNYISKNASHSSTKHQRLRQLFTLFLVFLNFFFCQKSNSKTELKKKNSSQKKKCFFFYRSNVWLFLLFLQRQKLQLLST
jgi:hypothetical protein